MVISENPTHSENKDPQPFTESVERKKKPSFLLFLPILLLFVAGVYLVVNGMKTKNVVDTDSAMNGTIGENQQAAATDDSVYVVNSGQVVSQGEEVPVDIYIKTARDVTAFEFSIVYDPAVLQLGTAELGPFLSSTGRNANILGPVPEGAGSVKVGGFTFGDGTGATGEGVVLTVMVTPLQSGETNISLDKLIIVGAENEPYEFTSAGGQIVVN